ncbi:MAG: transposase [Methylococcaceae bacterium]|nr:transposase [Methylococcaceae bacterium]
MIGSKRKIFTNTEKAKVALAAVKGLKTINEIAQEDEVHPTQVNQWKKELLDNVGSLFEGKHNPTRAE